MGLSEILKDVADRIPDGQMVVKGLCYEDIMGILLNNGYEVMVFSDAYEEELKQNITERKFHIAYWKSDVNKLLGDVFMGA